MQSHLTGIHSELFATNRQSCPISLLLSASTTILPLKWQSGLSTFSCVFHSQRVTLVALQKSPFLATSSSCRGGLAGLYEAIVFFPVSSPVSTLTISLSREPDLSTRTTLTGCQAVAGLPGVTGPPCSLAIENPAKGSFYRCPHVGLQEPADTPPSLLNISLLPSTLKEQSSFLFCFL